MYAKVSLTLTKLLEVTCCRLRSSSTLWNKVKTVSGRSLVSWGLYDIYTVYFRAANGVFTAEMFDLV